MKEVMNSILNEVFIIKEKIQEIPIWDAFNEDKECPVCVLKKQVEEKIMTRILGNDFFIDNRFTDDLKVFGFCDVHLDKLLKKQDRLTFGIILNRMMEQEIAQIESLKNKKKIFKKKKEVEYLHEKECYLCNKIDEFMDLYYDSIITLYKKKDEFKDKFVNSKGFCLEHFWKLYDSTNSKAFRNELIDVQLKNMKSTKEDLVYYLDKFDHKNDHLPWKNTRDSIERTIIKLNGEV